MAYQYNNDMSNQYNELFPDEYGNLPITPTPNITPITESAITSPNWDWATTSGLTNPQVINPEIQGGLTPDQVMTGSRPANWNILGDTLQDGFQFNDLTSWGSNLKGAVGDTLNNNRTVQTGQEMWGGLDAAGKFGTVFGGLQTLGGLYQGFKGMQMMKDQMAMQQDMWNKSWEANKKQFNESVESRAAGKYNSQASKTQRDEYQKKYSI